MLVVAKRRWFEGKPANARYYMQADLNFETMLDVRNPFDTTGVELAKYPR